jgi:hypothetical protein
MEDRAFSAWAGSSQHVAAIKDFTKTTDVELDEGLKFSAMNLPVEMDLITRVIFGSGLVG